jgi:hypothetical protein
LHKISETSLNSKDETHQNTYGVFFAGDDTEINIYLGF